jgi:hypothetical protein
MSSPPGNISGAVTKLLAGDNGQKLIMALVILAGGGNLLNTSSNNKVDQSEIESAIKEVHELHDALDPIIKRQQEMFDDLNDIKMHEDQNK